MSFRQALASRAPARPRRRARRRAHRALIVVTKVAGHHRHAGDAVRLGGRRARGADDPGRRRAPAPRDARHRRHGLDGMAPRGARDPDRDRRGDLAPDPLDARPASRSTPSARTATPRTSRGVNVSADADRSPTRSSGTFAALGGLALTAASGLGDPNSGGIYTLNSVAAVVLGGVSLLGGVGGLIGPIAAAFVLTLIKTILILKGVDQNWAQVIQGAIIVGRDDGRRPRDPAEGEDGRMTRRPRRRERRERPNVGAAAPRQPGDRADVRVHRAVRDHGHRQPRAERARVPDAEAVLDDVPLRGRARADRRRADARDADRRRRPLGGDDRDGGRLHGLARSASTAPRRRSRSRSSSGS